MSFTVIAFAVMATVAAGFVSATLARELQFKTQPLTQTGDSSLSPRSVNWLGASAFGGALFICFALV